VNYPPPKGSGLPLNGSPIIAEGLKENYIISGRSRLIELMIKF
jgi:hypothetical protein